MPVGAAGRLLNHRVDDTELLQVGRPKSEGPGRVCLELDALPENAGTALGTDHAVVGMLEHRHSVADADPERAPRTTLADHHADDRHRKRRHQEHAFGDHLGLAAFLSSHAGIGAGGVDQADHRQPVFGRQLHLAHRLAIALRMGAPEMAGLPFGEGLALLVADHHHLVLVELGEPGQHRRIVAEGFVAVEFHELVEYEVEVIAGLGPVGMSRDQYGLPGIERSEDLLLDLHEFPLQPSGLLLLTPQGRGFERGDPILDLVDRLFQRQAVQSGSHRQGLSRGLVGVPEFPRPGNPASTGKSPP